MKGSGLKPLDDCKSNEEVHVFGKNLEERVVTKDEEEESPSISINDNRIDEDIDSIRKRKFDAITGEEDEETIFQGDFKLFIWDLQSSNWMEKGRGQLKLNDSIKEIEKKSRLIMRVSGTLRIILNVAVDTSHFKVIANSKNNIRFTDSQTVWAARGSNADQLRDLLEERLAKPTKKRTQSELEDEAPSKKTKAVSEDEHDEHEEPEDVKDDEDNDSVEDDGTIPRETKSGSEGESIDRHRSSETEDGSIDKGGKSETQDERVDGDRTSELDGGEKER